MALSCHKTISRFSRFSCCVPNSRVLPSANCGGKRYRSNSKPEYKPQVFSGIQPTGVPHIGNYFGAIKPWIDMQNRRGNVILSVVDMHSITRPGYNAEQVRKSIKEMFAALLACGIDSDKTILFQQSKIHRHAELAWILGCLVTMPRLQHLPQWKVKSESLKEVPLGVFTYPVLQAADILLYKATDVPVGDDQVKHIELARDIAKSFNKIYGETFPQPKSIVGLFNRIKSLRSPLDKMSKSDQDAKSYIQINDSPDAIRGKMKKAVADFTPYISYDPTERPAVSNLINIHAAFSGLEPEEICEQCLHLDTLTYKMLVADVVIEELADVRTKFHELMENKDHLEKVIESGNDKAREIAEQTYSDVIHKVGFT